MFKELFPEFARVTDCVAEVVPSRIVPKFRLAGDKLTVSVGVDPVPDS